MPVRCGNREAHGRADAHHFTVAQVTLCCRVRPVDSIEEDEQAAHWLAEAASEQAAERAAERYFEERGYDDARAQEDHERAMGVIPFEEAFAAAMEASVKVEVVDGAVVQGNHRAAAAQAVADTSISHAPYDGVYTLESPPSGLEHRTFRLRTQGADDKFAPGKQVIAYLSGPDNESNYTGFGFVDRNALGYFVRVWKSFQSNQALQRDAEAFLKAPDEALAEAHCFRCHRRLTVPASVHNGVGPECAKKGS